jgi:hypothetical protein
LLGLEFKYTLEEAYLHFLNASKFYEKKSKQPSPAEGSALSTERNSITQRFVPFYGVEIFGLTTSFHGDYGIDKTVSKTEQYYDSGSKSYKTHTVSVTETDWYPVQGKLGPIDYPLYTLETQVYGDFEYPRDVIEKALRCQEVANLNPLTESMLQNSFGVPHLVELHKMKVGYGYEKIHERLYDLEGKRADEYCKSTYSADRTKFHFLDIHTNTAQMAYFAFHLPTFVFESGHEGNVFYKFMHGHNGTIYGEVIYHIPTMSFLSGIASLGIAPTIVATLIKNPNIAANVSGEGVKILLQVAAPVARAMVAKFGYMGVSLLGGAVGAVIGALGSYYYPKYKKRKQEQEKVQEKVKNETFVEIDEDRRYQNLIDDHEFLKKHKETREKQNREKANFNQNDSSKSNPYKRSYESQEKCKLLGLDPGQRLTKLSLTTAYHIQIKKWHPDVYDGDKKIALTMTQQINEAYSYLKKEVVAT